MKPRKPLLKSLLGKLRKSSATAAETQPRPVVRKPVAERKVVSSIEGLEGRIAPATLLNASTVTYTDFDGDVVTVKFSKNIFAGTSGPDVTRANAALKFSTGNVVAGPDATAQQLWLVDLSAFTTVANGVSITITAEQAGAGNGVADVGSINAANLALGTVRIDGDLGQVEAGRIGGSTALARLEVGSLGVRTDSQDSGAVRDIISSIRGTLGALVVHGDVKDARVSVVNGTPGNGITPLGNIGSVVIEGSLLGNATVAATSNSTGRIDAAGNIGTVRIGTDASEGIFGGGGDNSGQVSAGGRITSIVVSGKLVGGAAASSGTIFASATMGSVKIGIDPSGGIVGGGGASSGSVQAGIGITSAFVTGDVVGGTAVFSGTILANAGTIGAVTVDGDLIGGSAASTGRIQATTLPRVTLTGDIVAGTGEDSGGISATTLGVISIEDLDGRTASAGLRSAGISGGKLGSLIIDGSIHGGAGKHTGFVEIRSDIGAVTVRGDIVGGGGDGSASVIAYGKVASATVLGSVIGGGGVESGAIQSGFDPLRIGDLGTVKVLGRIEGGVGDKSGSIRSSGKITSVLVGTAGAPALDVLKGGDGERSGYIESQGPLGALRIFGNVAGGIGDFSGGVRALDRFETTGEIAGDLGIISITGQLRGGAGVGSGALVADGNLRSLIVGSFAGGVGAESGMVETGLGIVNPGHSGAIRVLGAFDAGGTPGAGAASILIGGNLTSLTIDGATSGATVRVGDALRAFVAKGNVTDSLVSARGQITPSRVSDVAIGSIAVLGNVSDSLFLAGYRVDGAAVNGDAQIGSVVVRGNWTASSLVAGVRDVDGDGFGDADDETIAPGSATIFSRIASIVIGGAVTGTAAGVNAIDHFGFTAQQVVKMKVGAVTLPLSATLGQVFEQDTAGVNGALGSTGNDVTIREIP